MPSYTLHYFEGRGLGEVSRQLFHISDTPFTDRRHTHEDWPKFKDSMPFGQMPVLEVDGKMIPQSFAIARYLAKQFGFAGKTPFDSAWVDALGDQFKDYSGEIKPAFAVLAGFTEGDKEKLTKDVAEPARDKFFGILEKILKSNGSGYLVGDSLTWIDLQIADHVETLENLLPGFLSGFPLVLAHRKKVQSTPKLKEWLDKRPKTKY